MEKTVNLLLGDPIPPFTPHAVSVSLPTWLDNIDYEEGNPRVVRKLDSGYPRFVLHRSVKKLNELCHKKFSTSPDETSLVLPSRRVAEECRKFMRLQLPSFLNLSPSSNIPDVKDFKARIVQFTITSPLNSVCGSESDVLYKPVQIALIIFPSSLFPLAKLFWQHSGEIVCSRLAEHCLRLLEDVDESDNMAKGPAPKDRSQLQSLSSSKAAHEIQKPHKTEELEQNVYLEERFGRNLELPFGEGAKLILRRRIAGVIGENVGYENEAPSNNLASNRGVAGVTEEDVYLFPCGMSAIYNAHRCLLQIFPEKKSVQFGFPYIDTLKILEKFGAGVYFLGHGDESDSDNLSSLLQSISSESPESPPILALFCEVPSNPLCRTPDLKKLRKLADQYGFFIVVDETIGNFVNVSVLQYADIVVSSLTKVFSGDSNVMGGSLILNPTRKHYRQLKKIMNAQYEDLLWIEEAIFLERNSRTFQQRIYTINENTEYLCDYLKQSQKVSSIFYPKYVHTSLYNSLKLSRGGYGGLFSIMFQTEKQASQFYDSLDVYKGPSLGTNFTLMCPYTILAHYGELEWAASFGVKRWLVRISVGLEDKEDLKRRFEKALQMVDDN